MAGENTQQQPGNGIDRPVIPLQNTETEIEIIEDEGARAVQPPAEFEHAADDKERAGSYEYDPDDEQGGQQTDARTGHVQQGGDEQAAGGESQEQLSARQRRRRRETEARNRERAELVRLRAENQQLKQSQQHIDTRLSAVEKAGIDGQISTLEGEIRRANLVMKRAMEAQNGDDFEQALEIRDAFRERLTLLKQQKEQSTKQQATTEPAQSGQQPGPGGMTQAQQSYGRIFMGRHPWFNPNPNVRDADSDTVRQLDNEMLAEGHNPSVPEYWIELERRIREDMPHKFQAANDGQQNGGGGQQNGGQQQQSRQQGNAQRGNGANGRVPGGPKLPGSGAGGSGAGGGTVKFHLSAARKQAMIDSGQWDDPVRKKRQIEYFIKWDKEHPQQ